VTLENGVEAWSMSPSKYVQEAVKNVKNYLQEKEPGRPWLKKAPTPFSKDYRPEIDISPKLGVNDATYYMSQIGVLRWMVELGRVDIITEVSMLASQLACPIISEISFTLPRQSFTNSQERSTHAGGTISKS
jgi:hypothetical protein